VKEDETGRACGTNVEKRNAYRISVAKTEGNKQLERPKHKWNDYI
jgi:hypothetical protein